MTTRRFQRVVFVVHLAFQFSKWHYCIWYIITDEWRSQELCIFSGWTLGYVKWIYSGTSHLVPISDSVRPPLIIQYIPRNIQIVGVLLYFVWGHISTAYGDKVQNYAISREWSFLTCALVAVRFCYILYVCETGAPGAKCNYLNATLSGFPRLNVTISPLFCIIIRLFFSRYSQWTTGQLNGRIITLLDLYETMVSWTITLPIWNIEY